MSKKKNFQGAEGFQRMNFLIQASHVVTEMGNSCPQLSCHYGNHISSIGKKLQLKMDPDVKRSLCKCCQGLLIPSLTASVQIKDVKIGKKKSRGKHKIQRWTCLLCKNFRDFPLRKDKLLWVEKSENN